MNYSGQASFSAVEISLRFGAYMGSACYDFQFDMISH